MYIDGKILDILYRQVAPGRLLEKLIEEMGLEPEGFVCSEDFFDMTDRMLFMDFAETTLAGYSENEQSLLYDRLRQRRNHWKEKHVLSSGFLVPLIEFANENLVIKDDGAVCKIDSVLPWREIYLRLGQDIPICAYLAYNDCENAVSRLDFSWPAIIRTDNSDLYQVLNKGMAENHNHLGGGTQSFQITWCRMMNYPAKIRTELSHFKGSNLNPRMSRGNNGKDLDLYDKLELAAMLRTILFRALRREVFYVIDDQGNKQVFDGKIAFYKEYMGAFSTRNCVEHIVDCLRDGYGAKLDMPDETAFCLDYVLDGRLLRRCKNPDVRVLAGERSFLYSCMRACMEKQGFSTFEQNLFYLYLVLQCDFRSEMIQANDQTGFKNFQNYQDRKDDAWDANPYFWEAARLGLNSRLNSEPIVSLEARTVPKADMRKNLLKIVRFDTAKRFADCPAMDADDLKCEFDYELDIKQFTDAPYFFVFHFVKVLDDRCLNLNSFTEPCCRHQKHRENLKKAAIGLVNALCEYPYLRCRIRGIDAAADEFGCRPEVFAVAYRYIDEVQKKWNAEFDGLRPSSPMRIRKTYHAGEDFLDIADGMRAIDEAIEYLEMEPCSRIGHALALGVEPEEHYRTKHYEIATTKQDRLDDLVWVLYRSKEFGVTINYVLESQLYREANHLLREIYGKAARENRWDCDLEKYRCSMKLRCDDPQVYFHSKRFEQLRMFADDVNSCLINTANPELDYYRSDDCIAGLYYYYQYGIYEGICGKETYTYKVNRGYIALMREIQEAMMLYLNKKRIIIECNPSSNVLIGSFKKYEKHPIFRFNNRKLLNMQESDSAQMHVCVNTDDLGVFDTSLEFEYALLHQALTGQMDESGRPVYSERNVMEYIDDLREMGIRAIFPTNV